MLKYILFVFSLCYAFAAKADVSKFVFPEYLDDETYEQCSKITNNNDECAKEESQRILRDVKILYKNLLADNRLIGWNGSLDKNKDMLRDMYESWTAYRNRICSLNVPATKYIAPLIDPKISCTLYQNFLQKDYLSNILHNLNINNPRNPYASRLINADGGNRYLEVDHDEQYNSCIAEKKPQDECIKGEIERTTKYIKNDLATILTMPTIEKWNNGPDIKNGNIRDMFDSWVAYRNRICSLTAYVQKIANPQKPVSFDYCIQYYNESFAALLDLYLKNANSVLDEDPTDSKEPEEGGAEEGRSLTPLKRHIVTDLDNSVASTAADDEDGETVQQADTASAPETTDKRGRQLPSWATK
ncbi:MAG: hypothetical protein MR350_06605 [Alphaproteobacteria bacterium]|nr:hypothetical protein [Alphaproteobacteria bacterium]